MAQSSGNKYEVEERGSLFTLDWRLYFKDSNGRYISPWHDIPLYADESKQIFNMIVEVPRWTNAKMEMNTKEPLNPIYHDAIDDNPRYVHNIFPNCGMSWNYGALTQTWEDPTTKDEHTGLPGDNDPIDVIEIGSKVHPRGVVQVKVVGALAVKDGGETDWTLVAIDVNDPMASKINEIGDVEKHFPGLLDASREWFRVYKVPCDMPPNEFAYNGEYKDREFTHDVIANAHEAWKKLMRMEEPELINQAHHEEAVHKADEKEWSRMVNSKPARGSPQSRPQESDNWHFNTA